MFLLGESILNIFPTTWEIQPYVHSLRIWINTFMWAWCHDQEKSFMGQRIRFTDRIEQTNEKAWLKKYCSQVWFFSKNVQHFTLSSKRRQKTKTISWCVFLIVFENFFVFLIVFENSLFFQKFSKIVNLSHFWGKGFCWCFDW